MVNWKVVLVVIFVAILAMAVGMWFGYQYVSEQEDISPGGHHEPPDTEVTVPQPTTCVCIGTSGHPAGIILFV